MSISISQATEKNQRADVRNVLYSVYFDWLNNNFISGPQNYDSWFKCFEVIVNNDEEEYIGIENLLGNLVISPQYSDTIIVAYDKDNIGNGVIEYSGDFAASYYYPGEGEIFNLISIDNEVEDQQANFIVYNKNITRIEDAVLNEPYGFDDGDNGYIKFNITSGDKKFAIGDMIKIYPALTTREYNTSGIITNVNDNDKVGLLVEGGPDFISWDTIEWLSEGNVRIFVRTCTDINEPIWGEWIEYNNGDSIASEQSRRYLQFKAILSSSLSEKAKLGYIKFSYSVKAHTNNPNSFQYEKDFSDLQSIRISRSKEFIEAGYGAADCDIILNNSHRLFNRENVASPYYNLIEPDLKCIVQLGFDNETVTKIEMYADTFSIDSSKNYLTIRGKDAARLFLNKTITDEDISSRVWLNKPIQFLIKLIAIDCNFPIDKLKLDDTTVISDIPYAFFNGKQAWKEIQDLVSAYECEVYITEDGFLKLKDRFKRRNLYRPPRYSESNYIYSILKNESNGQVFLVVKSYENTESFLYIFDDSEYTLIDTSYNGLIYVPEDQEDGFSTVYGVKNNSLIRMLGNSDVPVLEELITISSDYSFGNLCFYHNYSDGNYKYLYGIVKDRNDIYKYYRYAILNYNDEPRYQSSNTYQEIMNTFTIGDDNRRYYTLAYDAYDIDRTRVYYVSSLNNQSYNLVYGIDWDFSNNSELNSIRILKNIDTVNNIYFVEYLLAFPLNIYENSPIQYIRNPEKFNINYSNIETNLFGRNIILDTTSATENKNNIASSTYDTIFVLNFDTTGNLIIYNLITDIHYTYSGNVDICYGGVCDNFVGKIYLFISDNNEIKILSLDLFNLSNQIVDTGDRIYIDEINDVNLRVHDIYFNNKDKFTYIATGYADDSINSGILFSYRESYINVDLTNVVGKPLDKIVVKEPDDINSVIEKKYDMFFMKRGGIGAMTSQIWSWFSFIRDNDDKLKSAIVETLVTSSPTNTDSVSRLASRFIIPLSETEFIFDEIEYVYQTDIKEGYINLNGSWYKDTVNSEIVLFIPINVDTTDIVFGSGKVLKKYFGEYFNINGELISDWSNLAFASFPYKPTKVRFRGEGVQDGYIDVSGFDISGNLVNESLHYIPASGSVDGSLLFDKEYRGTVRVDASDIYVNTNSQLICESTYEDLIPGLDLYIYVNPNDIDEQFGGNGLVTSFTNEATIDVTIKNGVSEITKFIDEEAITSLYIDIDGYVYGATSYTGQFFVYSKINTVDNVVDFKLSYDSNINSSNYSWGNNNIKNSVKVTAKRMEAVPLREYEVTTGVLVNDIPVSSHLREWSELEILYKTQSPAFLSPGDYFENNITFSTPVLSRINNQLKFDAHISDFIGYVRANNNNLYIDGTLGDHTENVITDVSHQEYNYMRYKLCGNFIDLSGGIQPFQDPYTGDVFNINVPEAEKRNCDLYIGSRQLSYLSGDFNIINNSGEYHLLIRNYEAYSGIPFSSQYSDASITFHYPRRYNVNTDILERNINIGNLTGLSGDFTWSYVYDVDYNNVPIVGIGDNRLKYYYTNCGGFQLNVLWPNRTTYAENSYLRIENPSINSLDAYFDIESNPSGWSAWIDKVELRGLPIVESVITVALEKDLDSIEKYGEQSLQIENSYIQDVEIGQRLAKYALQNRANPVIELNQKILGVASMQLGDLVSVKEKNSSIDEDIFEVVSISDNLSIGQAYLSDIKLEKVKSVLTGTAVYDYSLFDKARWFK